MEQLFRIKDVPYEQWERCCFYYLSLLLAAHLPQQAREWLETQCRRQPRLAEHPNTGVFKVLLAVDMHDDTNELLLGLEGLKREYRKQENTKAHLECIQAIEAYLEKKPQKLKPLSFFQEDYEPLMRVDLWLQAKRNNQFYIQLVNEIWQERKKVIS
jgi:hypothetical protein